MGVILGGFTDNLMGTLWEDTIRDIDWEIYETLFDLLGGYFGPFFCDWKFGLGGVFAWVF